MDNTATLQQCLTVMESMREALAAIGDNKEMTGARKVFNLAERLQDLHEVALEEGRALLETRPLVLFSFQAAAHGATSVFGLLCVILELDCTNEDDELMSRAFLSRHIFRSATITFCAALVVFRRVMEE